MDKKCCKNYKIILLVVGSIIFLLISMLIIVGVGVYKYNWNNNFSISIVKSLPYPAASIDGSIVTYAEWQDKITRYKANKDYYLEQQDVDLKALDLPDDKLIEQQALEDLIKHKILIKLAKQNNIEITDAESDNALTDILSTTESGEETAEKTLQKVYGMTIKDFKEEVVNEFLMKQKLEQELQKQDNNILRQLSNDRINEIHKKITIENQEFETVARMYGEDGSVLSGGDIGYIGRGEMAEFYEKAVWNLEVGEVSSVTPTPEDYYPAGFYIMKVEDKRDNEGEDELKVRHIFIKIDLDKLLEQELKQANIKRWVEVE